MQETIKNTIINNLDNYKKIVRSLYENPEIGNKEFKSQKLLVNYLMSAGFDVKSAVAVPTDFVAKYSSKKEGPRIAFMCEYDALPSVGHGCGHNLIAGIGVAAGEGLKSVIDEVGGEVYVFGTPAEETFGGKVSMTNAGLFDGIDAALMLHPSTRNGLGSDSNALYPLKFEFFGKTAHGCNAYMGSSALDAAVMTYQGINMLRQMLKNDQRVYIHGIIKNGGEAANVIPDYSSMEYYFRAKTISYAKEIAKKATTIAQGACLATSATLKTFVYECPYEDTVLNYKLGEILKEKFTEEGIENIKPIEVGSGGSTDVGAVSYICPTIQGYIKIADSEVAGHSMEMADATVSEAGTKALLSGSTALAKVGLSLIRDKELLEAVKKEQKERLSAINKN